MLFSTEIKKYSSSSSSSSCRASLATFPYRSSSLAGIQGYILYPHIVAVYMFKLVVLLLPVRVHHL